MKNMTLNPEIKLKDLFGYGISGKQYGLLFAEEFTLDENEDMYNVLFNSLSVSDVTLPKRFFRPKSQDKDASDDGLDFVQVTVNGEPYYSERTRLKEFRRSQKAFDHDESDCFINNDYIIIKLSRKRRNDDG